MPLNPTEIIKDPMVLEFLDLKREAAYYGKDLESALITHLQNFLLISAFRRPAGYFSAAVISPMGVSPLKCFTSWRVGV